MTTVMSASACPAGSEKTVKVNVHGLIRVIWLRNEKDSNQYRANIAVAVVLYGG